MQARWRCCSARSVHARRPNSCSMRCCCPVVHIASCPTVHHPWLRCSHEQRTPAVYTCASDAMSCTTLPAPSVFNTCMRGEAWNNGAKACSATPRRDCPRVIHALNQDYSGMNTADNVCAAYSHATVQQRESRRSIQTRQSSHSAGAASVHSGMWTAFNAINMFLPGSAGSHGQSWPA